MRARATADTRSFPASAATAASRDEVGAPASNIPASDSSQAAVKTRLNECGSDDSELAGAIGGRLSGWR